MILGTAGHVDHGKTALVKALTGVDTDRWAEEKRRGITIDLGFAPLDLGDGVHLGVVDVPGHEAFVRNMLAGATGVDLALLVVAADEGVMPQTREHLAILSLLGIQAGVVALTKVDLVDDDWLELVTDDLRTSLADSPLADAPIIPTSVVSGVGLDALRAALAGAARAIPTRDVDDLFRLPIDRAFTVRGTGTVVTGTVWSGTLQRETSVRIFPGAHTARVRGIESHGAQVERARQGTRAAIALAGIELGDVGRGSWLVSDAAWQETRALLADVMLLADAPRALGPRTTVRFHLGTVEVGARVVSAGGALAPGERKHARVVLDAPVVSRAGDRFVLRSASPLATIGGGVVDDPMPPHRRARPWTVAAATPAERLAQIIAAAGVHGIPVSTLPVRLGVRPADVPSLLDGASGTVRRIGDLLYGAGILDTLGERLLAVVNAHHAHSPLEPGASLQSVRARLGTESALIESVLREQVARGTVEVNGALVARRGWRPTLTPAQERIRDHLARALADAGREPPSVSELAERFGADATGLLKTLEREGRAVQVELDRYYSATAVSEMIEALREAMTPGREYGPSDFRDLLGTSRKFLIPFLEYCDRVGVTIRRGNGRMISGVIPVAPHA
ncbi:MAG TPA: selenocysteine-specific translation elongation factor [Gemmatimonadaceae bacterium]|nr:selenocysteine-specific translation elongation factor [Gemmatimonadaceae bacterium]